MDRYQLLAVAGDLNYPAVELGQLHIAGEDRWRWALVGFPGAVPAEQRALLAALGPHLLIATEHAKARLEAWQGRDADVQDEAPAALRERIRADVAYYGDVEMLAAIVAAFVSAPRPVRETLLGDVAIVGTGWSSGGWCAPAIAPGPTYLIVVAGGSRNVADVARIARHELGHAWLTARQPLVPARTAYGQANVRSVAEAEQWSVIPAVDAKHAREERLAEALAVLWGMAS